VIGAAAALIPALPGGVRAVLVLPLVLLLPGYALSRAVFGRRSGAGERLVFALAMSVAVVALGGLVLNALPVLLTARSWTAFLVAVTLAAGLVAIVTRRVPTRTRTKGNGPPRVRYFPGALFTVAALAIFAGALVLARTPLPARTIEGYSVLWALPDTASPRHVRVAVECKELDLTNYRLEIRSGDTLEVRTFSLEAGQRWRAILPVEGTGDELATFQAILYRRGEPIPYRRVNLLLPV
jgi:hypothetical protein